MNTEQLKTENDKTCQFNCVPGYCLSSNAKFKESDCEYNIKKAQSNNTISADKMFTTDDVSRLLKKRSNEIRDKIEELIGQHPALYQLLHYFESELEKDRESRWITDRLPDDKLHVNVAFKWGNNPIRVKYAIFLKKDQFERENMFVIDGGFFTQDKIAGWQPLPEPPKL